MILEEKINIKLTNGKLVNFFHKKGIKCVLGEEIEIDTNMLSVGSNIKVKVKCDICGFVKEIPYKYYIKSINNGGYYSCNKCVNIKNKKTRLKIYGDENYNNREKQKETCIRKFGVDSYQKTDICKNGKREICLEKYGKESYTQSDEFKKKSKETCLKRYGKEYYSQTKESMERAEKTCLKKYKKRYYSQTNEGKEKVKKTSLIKYGKEYYSSSTECRNRVKETCLEKYGCEHPSQNPEIFKKQQLSGYRIKRYNNLYYQGTYELDFLMNFYDKLKIEKPKSIRYIYNDKTKIYFPDFYIPEYNLIVEIKSKYTYDLHKEINECKRKSVLENGYNFILIIDKDYTEFFKKYPIISNPE